MISLNFPHTRAPNSKSPFVSLWTRPFPGVEGCKCPFSDYVFLSVLSALCPSSPASIVFSGRCRGSHWRKRTVELFPLLSAGFSLPKSIPIEDRSDPGVFMPRCSSGLFIARFKRPRFTLLGTFCLRAFHRILRPLSLSERFSRTVYFIQSGPLSRCEASPLRSAEYPRAEVYFLRICCLFFCVPQCQHPCHVYSVILVQVFRGGGDLAKLPSAPAGCPGQVRVGTSDFIYVLRFFPHRRRRALSLLILLLFLSLSFISLGPVLYSHL